MDRGYTDEERIFKIHVSSAYFLTRAKDNMSYRRVYAHEKDLDAGAMCDQSIALNNHYASIDYPFKIRSYMVIFESIYLEAVTRFNGVEVL